VELTLRPDTEESHQGHVATEEAGTSTAMPPNWAMYTTDDGDDYFHNVVTGVTQWERPRALPGDKIKLRVRESQDKEVTLSVKKTTKMRILQAAACSRLGLAQGQVRFLTGGREIWPEASAETLGLAHMDVIEVQRVRTAGSAPGRSEANKSHMQLLDSALELEWRCPSCSLIHPVTISAVEAEPKLTCRSCGWQGFPMLQLRAEASEDELKPRRPTSVTIGMGRKSTIVASSGAALLKDFDDQHVEAPVGGMLSLVSQIQRFKICLGFLCYFLFCLNFVLVVTLVRPAGRFFEVQDSVNAELFRAAVLPSESSWKNTFVDVADWEDFWAWVDGVLVPKVYTDFHYGEGQATGSVARAPYSRFTIGKYNRVVTAIRFRQVRVLPTLPQCRVQNDGSYPDEYSVACTRESIDFTQSCDTPTASHTLSRPCWGSWDARLQDTAYPSAFQKETAQAALAPGQHLLCLRNCDAFYAQGLRSADEWLPFGQSGVRAWVEGFGNFTNAATALTNCLAACDVSRSRLLGNLSDLGGYCGSPEGKPYDLLYASESNNCWGDTVDLPLDGAEARRLVAAMRRERWTHEGTRTMVVEINTYNPNYDVATAVRAHVVAKSGGRLEPTVEMWSCRLSLYQDAVDYVRLALEVLFAFWILYYLVVELSEVYKSRWKYLSDLWNYVELASIAVYIYTLVQWVVFVNGAHGELRRFKARSPSDYYDLYEIAAASNRMNVAAFNLIYGFIRFFKYCRVSLRFKMIWDTLARTMDRMLPLLAIYLAFFFGFAVSGHWLFGARMEGFSTFPEAAMTLVLSVRAGIEYQELQDASSDFAGVLWYSAWFAASSLLLLSFFLVLFIHSFDSVKDQVLKQEIMEREDLKRGVKLPSPVWAWLQDATPLGLVWRGSKDKAARRARENITELVETLEPVDLEALWARLEQGVVENEVAVDAEELAFLFNGSAQKARVFINRVCNLANLQRVEVPEERTTLGAIADLRGSIEALGREVTGCSDDMEDKYHDLRPYLHKPTEGALQLANEAASVFLQAPALADDDEWDVMEVAGEGGDGQPRLAHEDTAPRPQATGGAFRVGLPPPKAKELTQASASLNVKRKNMHQMQDQSDSAVRSDTSAGYGKLHRPSVILHDELAQGRPAIKAFVNQPNLKRL